MGLSISWHFDLSPKNFHIIPDESRLIVTPPSWPHWLPKPDV